MRIDLQHLYPKLSAGTCPLAVTHPQAVGLLASGYPSTDLGRALCIGCDLMLRGV